MPLLPHPVWPPLWLTVLMWLVVLLAGSVFVSVVHFVVKFW